MKTGVIGLGAMGAPMARNLHHAGHLACVWNRSPDKSAQLRFELDVPVAGDPAELARRCELIILSVSADEDVLQVIDALLPGVQPGAVVLDTSTVSRATACAAAERLAGQADFLDAPVSGGIEGARKGTLAMMVGGDAAVLERIRPVLESVAARVEHMGPVGAGQATKAVNQVMAAGINQAVSEALAFAEALGLPLDDKVIEVVGSGAAGNWFLTHRGPTMSEGKYDPGFRVALHHKDLAICKQMAEQFDVALPVIEMTLIHYRRLMEAGFGDEDISALLREKRALFTKQE